MKQMSDAMAEATRLTREGRLFEATVRLREFLGGGAHPKSASPGDHEAEKPGIDMVAPSDGRSASWTAPSSAAAQTGSIAPPDREVDGFPNLKIPTALQGLVQRFRRAGGEPGLAGRDEASPQALPQGARFVEKNFTNAHGHRSYKLYVPSGYRRQPVPLVIMLHGCTQSPDDFAAGTRMNLVAEERTCLVAYPAQPKAANASKCWNWFRPQDQQRDKGEPSLIAGIARQIMSDYAVDPARIYIAGLSAGGAAAANLASLYPDLFAAVGVHSGLACGAATDLPSAFAAMKNGSSRRGLGSEKHPIGIPVIVFHGDQDGVVNCVNADRVVGHSGLSRLALRSEVETGVSAGGRSYTVARDIDPEEQVVVEQWTIHGAGHAWSGGGPSGSYTDPAGPDASREMMRFFFSHRRKAVGVA